MKQKKIQNKTASVLVAGAKISDLLKVVFILFTS